MGLQNQLSDVSSESFVICLVVLVAKSARYLQSLLFTILRTVGLFSQSPQYDDVSESTGFLLLCEQLNLNRVCSYPNRSNGCGLRFGSDCVVCLNRLNEGDNVRKLTCQHVFHKDCFDGWLDQRNFTCPLCRTSLVAR